MPVLLAAVLVAALGFAGGAVLTGGPVSGEESVAAKVSDPQDVTIDQALSEPEPVLPSGMPTAVPDTLGRPLDPLSPEEIGYARFRAVSTQKNAGERVDGTPGYQFISVELAPGAESSTGRTVLVTSFDYKASALVTQIVDLRSGTVRERTTVGAQPPPSRRESAYAMDLLVHSPAGGDLRARFLKATGTKLTSADQLRFRAGTYTAGGKGAEQCGVHRCLTFQGASEDGDWFYFGNIAVDLTDGVVRTIL